MLVLEPDPHGQPRGHPGADRAGPQREQGQPEDQRPEELIRRCRPEEQRRADEHGQASDTAGSEDLGEPPAAHLTGHQRRDHDGRALEGDDQEPQRKHAPGRRAGCTRQQRGQREVDRGSPRQDGGRRPGSRTRHGASRSAWPPPSGRPWLPPRRRAPDARRPARSGRSPPSPVRRARAPRQCVPFPRGAHPRRCRHRSRPSRCGSGQPGRLALHPGAVHAWEKRRQPGRVP